MQFFDLTTWFTLHIHSEQFICPVCNRYRSWSSVYYDDFFAELLHKIPPNIEKIQIFPDRKWEIVHSEIRNPSTDLPYTISDESIQDEVYPLSLNDRLLH